MSVGGICCIVLATSEYSTHTRRVVPVDLSRGLPGKHSKIHMTRYRGQSDISSLLNHSHPRCHPGGVEHMARVLQSRCCVLRSRSQTFLKLCYPTKVKTVTTLQTRCSAPLLGSLQLHPIQSKHFPRSDICPRS
jgi:hypothetical protein